MTSAAFSPPPPGELALALPKVRARARWLVGPFVAFPTFGFFVGIALPLLVVRTIGWAGGAVPLVALGLALALVACAVVPPFVYSLRAPGGARLTWDAREIVEWDGALVRTAIEWSGASARDDGAVIQLRDAEGRTISIAREGRVPPWLRRRAATASDVGPLVAAIAGFPEGPAIAPDARDARRPTMGRGVAIATGIVGGLAYVLLYAIGYDDLAPLVFALTLALLHVLPCLRPAHELIALLGEARAHERAIELSVEAGEHASDVIAARADGTFVRCSIATGALADARAVERGGTLHVTLPRAGWVPAEHRSGVGKTAVAADAAETAQARSERARLRRAVVVELVARCAAVLFWGWLALP